MQAQNFEGFWDYDREQGSYRDIDIKEKVLDYADDDLEEALIDLLQHLKYRVKETYEDKDRALLMNYIFTLAGTTIFKKKFKKLREHWVFINKKTNKWLRETKVKIENESQMY